jgi:hypothetical protein
VESLEQELMDMLRRLPVAVIITWRSGQYHWQCLQGSGASHSLINAVEAALVYLMNSSSIQERKKIPNNPGAVR